MGYQSNSTTQGEVDELSVQGYVCQVIHPFLREAATPCESWTELEVLCTYLFRGNFTFQFHIFLFAFLVCFFVLFESYCSHTQVFENNIMSHLQWHLIRTCTQFHLQKSRNLEIIIVVPFYIFVAYHVAFPCGQRTPLHWASRYCRDQAVSLLVRHGANCNTPDCTSRTPLHWAVLAPYNTPTHKYNKNTETVARNEPKISTTKADFLYADPSHPLTTNEASAPITNDEGYRENCEGSSRLACINKLLQAAPSVINWQVRQLHSKITYKAQ